MSAKRLLAYQKLGGVILKIISTDDELMNKFIISPNSILDGILQTVGIVEKGKGWEKESWMKVKVTSDAGAYYQESVLVRMYDSSPEKPMTAHSSYHVIKFYSSPMSQCILSYYRTTEEV